MFKFIIIKSHFLQNRGNNGPVKFIRKYTRLKGCIHNSTQCGKQSSNVLFNQPYVGVGSIEQDLLGHFFDDTKQLFIGHMLKFRKPNM